MTDSTPTLSADQLEHAFADIAPPLTPDAAVLEATKCLFCYDAPCTAGCATHIDVPGFIKKIATGNLRGAARVILEANPMGHSCARACPVDVMCEGACVLNQRDEQPVRIALLQRYATDFVLERGLALFHPGEPTGRRVAVIGAGPAGLSCARDLRRYGHAVTCFEAKGRPGGLNTYGIAEYKMRPETALAEAQDVLDLGVDLRTNVTVGEDVPFAQILEEYDAVFVAIGLASTRALGIPGDDLPGVLDALTFIEHLKQHPYTETRVGRRVVVIGAGNTAIDAVTQAKRLGADVSMIVYRRGEGDKPCYDYEYELAKADGCRFQFHSTPTRVVGDEHVTGLEVETPEGTQVVPCEMVIAAIGQERRTPFEVPTDHPKVFVGGDFANGGAEIVNAAADGIDAARAIHQMLQP